MRRAPISSAPPAAYNVVATTSPAAISAAAAPTPTGALGKAARGCQRSVSVTNETRGITCTVAVRWSPAGVVRVSGPATAPSGTVTRTARSLQPPAPTTAAGMVPPPAPAKVTPPRLLRGAEPEALDHRRPTALQDGL